MGEQCQCMEKGGSIILQGDGWTCLPPLPPSKPRPAHHSPPKNPKPQPPTPPSTPPTPVQTEPPAPKQTIPDFPDFFLPGLHFSNPNTITERSLNDSLDFLRPKPCGCISFERSVVPPSLSTPTLILDWKPTWQESDRTNFFKDPDRSLVLHVDIPKSLK